MLVQHIVDFPERAPSVHERIKSLEVKAKELDELIQKTKVLEALLEAQENKLKSVEGTNEQLQQGFQSIANVFTPLGKPPSYPQAGSPPNPSQSEVSH